MAARASSLERPGRAEARRGWFEVKTGETPSVGGLGRGRMQCRGAGCKAEGGGEGAVSAGRGFDEHNVFPDPVTRGLAGMITGAGAPRPGPRSMGAVSCRHCSGGYRRPCPVLERGGQSTRPPPLSHPRLRPPAPGPWLKREYTIKIWCLAVLHAAGWGWGAVVGAGLTRREGPLPACR